MADVTGPISTLPGAAHQLPDAAMCDTHPDRPAVARIQGETDSFGCELNDLCAECLASYRAEIAADREGKCDWCKAHATDLCHHRDFDEGACGPVYRVCGACVRREREALKEELDDEWWD